MLDAIIPWLILGTEACAAVILVIAVIAGLWELIGALFRARFDEQTVESRRRLGRRLVLVLELLIAAAILRSILAADLTQLAILGIVFGVRMAMGWSLRLEMRRSSAGTTA